MSASTLSRNTFFVDGHKFDAPTLPTGLFVTSTPIGNLGDITLRALRVLAAADVILCEDTRVTRKLSEKYGIETPLRPYHDHNAESVRPQILTILGDGASVALVSDAGTPLVSDPGYKLVRAALDAGIPVTAAPGASAPMAAMALAGLPSDRFLFAGFPPAKQGQRRSFFAELERVPATLVFFASARKLGPVLADIEAYLGDREAVIARELTKLHEEVLRGPVSALKTEVAGRASLKGEVTLLVSGAGAPEAPEAETLDRLIQAALGSESVRDVADRLSSEHNLPRRQIYARALEISKAREDGG